MATNIVTSANDVMFLPLGICVFVCPQKLSTNFDDFLEGCDALLATAN